MLLHQPRAEHRKGKARAKQRRRAAAGPLTHDMKRVVFRIAFGEIGARHAQVASDPLQGDRQDRRRPALLPDQVAPADQECLIALPLAQFGKRTCAIQRDPQTLRYVADQLDFAVPPAPRRHRLNGERGAHLPLHDQRDGDEGANLDLFVIGFPPRQHARIAHDIVVPHDAPRFPLAGDRCGNLRDGEAAPHDAAYPVAPIGDDDELTLGAGCDRIGGARGAQIARQALQRGRHHLVRGGQLTQLVAPFDQESLIALAIKQRGLGTRALQHRPQSIGDLAEQLHLALRPHPRPPVLNGQQTAGDPAAHHRHGGEGHRIHVVITRPRRRIEPRVGVHVMRGHRLAGQIGALDRIAHRRSRHGAGLPGCVAPFVQHNEPAPPAVLAFRLSEIRAGGAQMRGDRRQRRRYDNFRRGLGAQPVTPRDHERLVAFAPCQFGLRSRPLQCVPGTISHVADQRDLAVAPTPRRAGLYRQDRRHPSRADQRDADEGTDLPLGIDRHVAFVIARIAGHVVVADDLPRHPFALGLLADIAKRHPCSHQAGTAVAPIPAGGEHALHLVRLGIGDPRGAEMTAKPLHRHRHDVVGCGERAQGVGPFDQECLIAFARLQRLFGAGALQQTPHPFGDLADQRHFPTGPVPWTALFDRQDRLHHAVARQRDTDAGRDLAGGIA